MGSGVKYRCNICGKIYDKHEDCIDCVKKHRLQNLDDDVNIFIVEKTNYA